MNVLPALANHLQQLIPNLYVSINDDETISLARIIDESSHNPVILTIVQSDNVLAISTQHRNVQNPCSEITIGPTFDLFDPQVLQKITNIVESWSACFSLNSPKSPPGSTNSDPEPKSVI